MMTLSKILSCGVLAFLLVSCCTTRQVTISRTRTVTVNKVTVQSKSGETTAEKATEQALPLLQPALEILLGKMFGN